MMEPSIIPTRPPQYQTTKCPKCTVVLEYQLQQPSPNLKPNGLGPSVSGSPYSKLQCYSCNYLFPIPVTPQPSPTPSAKSFSSASKFRPGTDSSPLSMEYYEILGVSHLATPAEIKKAYYSLAMKYHPDKCRDLSHEEAEEKFKKISEAYQVLSDPVLRKKYNEFGPKGSCPEGGFMNPEEFFQAQFGGDRFIDIIGELAIAKHFKSAMVDEEDEEEAEKSGEIANAGESTTNAGAGTSVSNGTSSSAKHRRLQKRLEEYELRRQERDERIKKLAENLVNKLKSYDPSNPHEFRSKIEAETEELKIQNYGLQLLHSIGYIYTNKSVEYLSKDEFLGFGSWMTKMKLKGHAIGETFSTIKSAVDVHKSFIELQEEEKRGWGGREDIKAKMEEEAARRGIDALWQGSKLEIESVLKGVCDRVLGDATVERGERKRRADGLKIIGEVYRGAKLE